MLDLNNSLFVEYCTNCSSHAWCTSHDEARYYSFFLQVKENIERRFPDLKVYGNTHPSTGKKIVPNLGAFEVIYKTCKIFSKIRDGIWPSIAGVETKVEMINNGIWPEETDFVTYKDISINEDQIKKFKRDMADKGVPVPNKRIPRKEPLDEDAAQKAKEKRKNREYVVRKNIRTTSSKLTDLKRIDYKEIDSPQLNSRSNIESRIVVKNGIAFSTKPDVREFRNDFLLPNGQRKSVHDVQPFAVRKVQTPYSVPFSSVTPSAYSSISVNKLRAETSQNKDNQKAVSCIINTQGIQIPSDASLVNTNEKEREREREKPRAKTAHQQPKSLQEIPNLTPTYQLAKLSVPSFLKANTVREELVKDKELPTSPTIFTTSILRPNKVHDDALQVEIKPGQRLKWFPDCQKHNTSPDRLDKFDDFEEAMKGLLVKDSENKELHPLTDRKLINLHQAEQVAEYDRSDNARNVTERSLIKMIRTCFPEEKAATIKISKDRVAKKKITIVGDKNKDSKIEVYCTWSNILKTESHVIKLPRGVTFKIPLRLSHYDVENTNKCQLFLFKDDQPWQKIRIEPDYV